MKTTLAILLLCASACLGQNILVNFWPTNQPYQGLTNWPQGVKPVSWSTNTPGWATNMTLAAYSAYVAAQQPVYDAGVSNAQFNISSLNSSNYAAWISIYTNIALGVADTSNRMANVTSLTASWKSGTNSAAGTNNIITSMFSHWYYDWVYFNQVLQYLKVLGPGVQPPPQQ